MAEPKKPALDDFLSQLRLPEQMAASKPDHSKAVANFESLLRGQIRSRRFVPGLAMAFISMAETALSLADVDSVDDVLAQFKRQETTAQEKPVNTLNLVVGETLVRLRPAYNAAEHVFIHGLRRYDYPNAAPHATQAWPQHVDMLTAVFAMSPEERKAAAEVVWKVILELPEQGRRSIADASPRPFETVLTDFPGTQQGEPGGAILQGLAFAYYRADAPNVTLETGKVGASSRRTGRAGDVDGWNGAELVLSIEVKDEELTDPEDPTLDGFLANLAEWPDATAIVVVRGATGEVVEELADVNIRVLTRDSMRDAVVRWDINKQSLAAREFHYFLVRVQRDSGLIERYEAFLEEQGIEL
ncbi:MAG: hypothetical protein M3540_09415 [Actinomycetota bacterium]|nr:hypothetical protein [Actinomycetota bacterium]